MKALPSSAVILYDESPEAHDPIVPGSTVSLAVQDRVNWDPVSRKLERS